MREQAVVFGETHALVGVVTQPDRGEERPGTPAFVLLNAGLLHRVGPNRLYVTLARSLAKQGFTTLRFDMAGLGDSQTRRDQLNYSDGAVADTLMAMNFLARQHGFGTFVLGGLCSGADQSFITALHDGRVVGTVLLDWYAYRTLGYHLRYYGPKMFRPGPWLRTVKRVAARVRSPNPATGNSDEGQVDVGEVDPYARYMPPQQDVAGWMAHLLERGTRLLCVYTGGQDALYNYAGQFKRMFPGVDLRGQVRTDFIPGSTHTFTLKEHRQQVEAIVLEWTEDLVRDRGAAPPPAQLHAPVG